MLDRPGAAPAGTFGFADTDGHARRAYGTGDALLLIRPDGYLGLAVDAGGEAGQHARAYLATITA